MIKKLIQDIMNVLIGHKPIRTITYIKKKKKKTKQQKINEILDHLMSINAITQETKTGILEGLRIGIKWLYAVIHHSWTKDKRTVDTKEIKKYHTSYRIDSVIVTKKEFERRLKINKGKRFQKPWSDIGYNFLIEKVNGVWKIIVGRPLYKIGGHTKGFNKKAFGVCVIGKYDAKAPDEYMVENILIPLIKIFMIKFGISANKILGHRETYKMLGKPVAKSCPGKKFDMEELRKKLV